MGNFLESIGVIDGYDIIKIGKSKAEKDEIFEEIEKYDNNIKEKVRTIVNESSGVVFAIIKDKVIKGLYVFEIEKKKEDKNLKHIETVYTDEVPIDVREKYNNKILEIAKSYVSSLEFNKVILEDKVVQPDHKISKKESSIASLTGFLIGFLIGWMISNDIIFGIVFGIILGPLFLRI